MSSIRRIGPGVSEMGSRVWQCFIAVCSGYLGLISSGISNYDYRKPVKVEGREGESFRSRA